VAVARFAGGPGRLRLRTPAHTLLASDRRYEPDPQLVDCLRGLIESSVGLGQLVRPGDRVLVKPNFNSGDPPPNSTDLPLIVALIRLLFEQGAGRVTVGEGSRHPPTSTRFELRRSGLVGACRAAGAEVAVFGEAGWIPIRTRGNDLRWVEAARPLLECDRLIFLCCLKTHWLTRFSISLKHSVGCVRPRHRARLHFGGDIEGKVAEIASAFDPDLVIVDGRSCYARGGPCYGFVRNGGVMLAGRDRVALDVTGVRAIKRIPGNALTREPWSYRQIRQAVALGLGASNDAEIRLLEQPHTAGFLPASQASASRAMTR
jgi:uncharacterized protein (DUF362 family)